MPYQNENTTPGNGTGRSGFAARCLSFSKRVVAAASLCVVALPLMSAVSATTASAETRSLKLYYTHTREKAEIVFKRNGRFDPKGLAQLNQFLRDWRRNEPTKMDPRLFDLVWEVYRRVGAKDYIHIVSAYRSPATNGMLRSRTKGVAKNSQHTQGKAMDFFIPGVKLSTLRGTAMQLQVGGVGFYPTSGSPFVHLDVGGVRAWPRMSRDELARLFPKGNTIHLPSDGKPLPGYDQALADYKKRVGADSIEIASTAGPASSATVKKKKNLLAMLFGGGDEDEDPEAITTPAPAAPGRPAAPATADDGESDSAPVMVASAQPQAPTIDAPVPQSRPAFRQDGSTSLANALYSQGGRSAAQDALQAALPAQQNGENFADLQQYTIPVPTLLGPRGMKGDADTGTMTAYAAAINKAEMSGTALPVPAHRPAFSAGPMNASLPSQQTQQLAAASPQAVPNTLDAQAQHLASGGAVAEGSQALTPELVAALAKGAEYSRASEASVPVPGKRPVQVALANPAAANTAARTFGDGFDAPKAKAPVKQAPTANAAPSQAAPADKSLTGDVLAQWAQTKGKVEASAKAPRVVSSRSFSTENTAMNDGFKPAHPVQIDPGRF
ncbi:DUF882 domain-containing protein [Neorhizobium sp. JUb45]|uniref:DUF882 domain-containing protein n=1 Tax=unclassified Neorhizobium TaxID=2629175 RepID=UPI00104D693D|nr:DUF882 domain-containing protein [Neorhizobium sp. JUb45]TCR06445.1 uncharacterized protein YcbK (DUF882 family) [Neorhizobium sp. JUb45]